MNRGNLSSNPCCEVERPMSNDCCETANVQISNRAKDIHIESLDHGYVVMWLG